MNTTTPAARAATTLGSNRDAVAHARPSFYARYFFVAMAVVFIAINALGFVPQLVFIHAQKISLHWFTHVHGAVMTGWLFLFFAQALLAAIGRLGYHRQLGMVSAGWGVIVWLSSIAVQLSALIRDNPPELSEQFDTLAVGLVAMIMFGLFFSWGLSARRNAAVHKRLLFLAMLPLMSAGIDRIGFLPGLEAAFFVRFVYLDAMLLPLLVYDLVTVRRFHRVTCIGAIALVASQVTVVGASASTAWHQFVYRSLTPFVPRVPEVQLSDAQSDPLLGDYGGKDWKMTVGRDGGKCYLQMPNLPKWEMGAYSETQMFLKLFKMKLDFVKDSQARVTKVVVTQPDKTWEAARVELNH